MTRKSITLELDSDEFSLLSKRAKKCFMSEREMVQDIIRRSMLSYKKGNSSVPKVDDSIVGIISRERKGRKRII